MRLLTLEQAAERLALSPRSLKNTEYRKKLGLPIIRLTSAVRVIEEDLDSWIKDHRQAATGREEGE